MKTKDKVNALLQKIEKDIKVLNDHLSSENDPNSDYYKRICNILNCKQTFSAELKQILR